MSSGDLLIGFALGTAAVSMAAYAAAAAGAKKLLAPARILQAVSTASVLVVAAFLFYYLLANRFDIRYVHDYSSASQKLVYKISAFWGGQEGSWLLWLSWIGAIGLLLRRRMAEAEAAGMAFWLSLQTFFLVVLAIKSPFAPTGTAVTDGVGLNPLLQNYWMAIHPPILFCGFTLICVPAAFAAVALVLSDRRIWSRAVFAWAVSGWTVLGVGLLLGGVWAYETLGWGGFWGWDPVENASLVPWLLGGALLHGLLLERSQESLSKLNLVTALGTFLLVIYATFLTRSGVLGDFSVHSFAALESSGWLLGFLIAYTAAAAGLLVWRSNAACPSDDGSGISISSKELLVFCGIVLFGLGAGLVGIGMSSPLLSKLIAGEPGNVPTDYYFRVMTPIALAVILLIGFSPLVNWGGAPTIRAWRRARVALVAAAAAALIAGLTRLLTSGADLAARQTMLALAGLAILPSIWALSRNIRAKGLLPSGGHLAHVGMCVFLIGVVLSSWNNKARPDRITLEEGKPLRKLGLLWKLNKIDTSSQGKQRILITAVQGRSRFALAPEIQQVRDGSMLKPSIHRKLSGDLYVAPVSVGAANLPPHARAAQGKPVRLGPYRVTFTGFTPMQQVEGGQLRAGARLSVTGPDGSASSVISYVTTRSEGLSFAAANIPGTKDSIGVATMDVAGRSVTAVLDGPSWRRKLVETATIEVTFKPMVWLVWLGATMIAAGGATSAVRRSRESRLIGVSIPEQIEELEGSGHPGSPGDTAHSVERS